MSGEKMADGEERYYHNCAVCGKRYYRKYASDYPEQQWWLNLSHRIEGGVCSKECARKTPMYLRDKSDADAFMNSLTTDQRVAMNKIAEFIHDDYDYEYHNLLGLGDD